MCSDPHADDPDKLQQEINESIERMRDLAEGLTIV
jgi:hypothetical protein